MERVPARNERRYKIILLISSNWQLKACVRYFYQIFISSPNDSPLETMKNVFISSKKLFSFLRYSNFCNFFLHIPHFPDTKGQMQVKQFMMSTCINL